MDFIYESLSNHYLHPQTAIVYILRTVALSGFNQAICVDASTSLPVILGCAEKFQVRLVPNSLSFFCGNGYPSDYSHFDEIGTFSQAFPVFRRNPPRSPARVPATSSAAVKSALVPSRVPLVRRSLV